MNFCKAATSFLLIFSAQAIGQTSFWSTSPVPLTPQASDSAAVTVGLKFYSTVPGVVTGIRFYKGTHNTGTHVGALWSATGTKLAQVTFTNETSYGWQRATFATPITITANTTYVVSYLAPVGRYAADQYYSWSSITSPSLRFSGTSPSVYVYGSTIAFPTSTFRSTNYYVDVLFTAQSTTTPTYNISGRISGSAATVALSGAATKSTTTDSLGNFSFTGLLNGSYVVTPSQAGYTFSPASTSVSINNASVSGLSFTAAASPSTTTYSISGTVTGSSATVTLSGTSGGTTTTDSLGNYRFSGLVNGNYVVAPSRTGYAFTPSTASVSINGASRSGVNFTAAVSVSRSVTLNWVASTTAGVTGYNIYRGTTSGGPYTKLTASPYAGTSYTDNNVSSGRTYYYVATSVSTNATESSYSSQATAVVP